MPLSDEEIQELRNKAQACLDAWRKAPEGTDRPRRGKPVTFNLGGTQLTLDADAVWGERSGYSYLLREALEYYDKIIENAPPQPGYFEERAEIFSEFGGFNLINAIKDLSRALELNTDNPFYYQKRAFYGLKICMESTSVLYDEIRQQLLEKSIADSKASLSRDPTNVLDWFMLMAANIFLYNWDEAIGHYGSCKPFIAKKEDQLIRACLGCTALALAGDPIGNVI